MKKLIALAVLSGAALIGPDSAMSKKVTVYRTDGTLQQIVDNVRRIEFANDKINLVTHTNQVNTYNSAETGYLSFSQNKPTAVEEIVSDSGWQLSVAGLEGTVTGLPATATVTVVDINGRETAHVKGAAGTAKFRVPDTGVYVVAVECADKCSTFKIAFREP